MSHLNFDGGDFFWLWLCIAIAVVAAIIVLYRYERRLVTARIGNVLLALRLTAVAALFVTLLQPVLTRSSRNENRGEVVVALDVSESMRTADPHATDEEKSRWARALQLSELQLDSAGQTLDAFNSLNRLEIATRLLTSTSTPLIDQLEEFADVRLTIFAAASQSIDPQTLSSVLDNPPQNVQGQVSDLTTGFSAVNSAADDISVIGVVLLTDGRDTTEHDPTMAARSLGRSGIPVFPVVFGSRKKPADISVVDLDFPTTVFKGDTPRLTVTLGTTGFVGREIDVLLTPEAGAVIRKKVTPDGATADVQFDLAAETPGRQVFTVSTTEQQGEIRTDNNSTQFAMTVIDDTIRVLLLDGEARWEFRFIDNAYRRDSRVDVSQVVFDQPFLGVLEETFFARKLEFPDEPSAWDKSILAETDLVIIGDVSPQHVTPKVWETLEKYVEEGRGTLVFLAGKNHFPLTFDSPILERLLPLSDLHKRDLTDDRSKAPPRERGFHLRLTPDGEREPILQFATDDEKNRVVWREFPGHLWAITGKAKPAATILATIESDEKSATADNAVIARQAYGLGQVMWLGIDSTWRWRYRAGDRYHHRFWGQLARWAANNRSVSGNDLVKFGPAASEVEQGEEVVLRARFSRLLLERFPLLTAQAELFHAKDKQRTRPLNRISLSPAPGRPLAYEGNMVNIPPGEYVAKLNVIGAELDDEELTAPVYVSKKRTTELADVSANIELLEQIAAASGGKLLSPDELSELPALLATPANSVTDVEEFKLWDHWLVLAIFAVLVTAEWIVRKLHGLP